MLIYSVISLSLNFTENFELENFSNIFVPSFYNFVVNKTEAKYFENIFFIASKWRNDTLTKKWSQCFWIEAFYLLYSNLI